MIKRFLTVLFVINIFVANSFSVDLFKLFPAKGELPGWSFSDSIKVFKGDDLFNYVDGGAEVFMEYGFKQVATSAFLDKNNNQMQVEIYEMSDSAAAFGAYSFYLNGQGKVIKDVPDGVFMDYYAVFWKSNLLTVISLTNPNDSLISAISSLAKIIFVKMPPAVSMPSLVSRFKDSGLAEGYIKFFKGNVSLGNFYKFIPGDAFKFKEGIGYTISGAKIIVLKYDSDSFANSGLEETQKKMQDKNKEANFIKLKDGFSFSDYRSNKVWCRTFKNFVIIMVDKSDSGFNMYFEKVSNTLASIN